ncbi:alpha/beta hydrolase [Pseudomonas fluorescens]|uniref:Alpha/beta hydrolase n=1 Tax=Pseudomonas fluorescens TaxID=294 RepID=A0A327N7Z5_PSEFL|nr:alpha/beta fold hydrolase [Pseudomonas fluorescens]RAI70853.1 alpha/beta hydrolase [Pseudomonas fluorescens]
MSQRLDVSFPSANAKCAAWLYLPQERAPHPVIVMAHGLGGVREMRLDAFAERFCDAGYACLVFDYRNFGASEGEPRQVLDIGSQLEDWQSAIAFARDQKELDAAKVILWGTSFSGGHVIHTAVADRRIAAVIAQCPFTDGVASFLKVDMLTSLKLTALGIADVACSLLGAAPVAVKLAGPKGSAALMTAPDAEPGYLGLVPEKYPFKNYAAARFALAIGLYRPGMKTPKLRCPILFCICDTDSVAPPGPSLRHAKRANDVEIHMFQEGHFDIYVGEAFERVIEKEISFLKRRVPLGAARFHAA